MFLSFAKKIFDPAPACGIVQKKIPQTVKTREGETVDGCGLVQFIADIRIRINFHTLFIGWTVYDTGKNKTSDKNYQSKTHII